MSTTLFKMLNASFKHRNEVFYENFNWTVKEGENWIISGPCGAGKTSLVNALSGKYYPIKGSLTYPFLEATGESIYAIKKKLIRVVSFRDDSRVFSPNLYFYQQRFNAFAADGTLTVWEYLMNAGFDERIKEHIDLVKKMGVYSMLDLERIKLSSGQSRRLLITKAILQEPKILIIDNPYLGLDAPSRKEFNQLLDNLVQESGIQLILAGHYKELPNCISHELCLADFQVQSAGPLALPAIEKVIKPVQQTQLIDKIKALFTPPTNSSSKIFDLKNVKVAYGDTLILDHINWTVSKGEKWALLGDNGSGKSTILSLLFGDHTQAYANDIHLFGTKRGMGQSIWDIKKNTGFTSPELHYFFSYELTCLQTVISGLFDHVYLKRAPDEKEQQLIDLLFEYFELSHLKDQSFQKISTGQQRTILFLRALVKNPPLLLLDEPFQGLDTATINKAKRLLSAILTAEHTLVFISHYVEEIPDTVNLFAYLAEGLLRVEK